MRILIIILSSVILFLSSVMNQAYSVLFSETSVEVEIVESEELLIGGGGVYGGVNWSLSSDGVLTLGNGKEQSFILDDISSIDLCPWLQLKEYISGIKFTGVVYGNEFSDYLFSLLDDICFINRDSYLSK